MFAGLDLHKPLTGTLDDVLSAAECDAFIADIEARGPIAAPVKAPSGGHINPEQRNNSRVLFEDATLAAEMFARVRAHLPEELLGRRVCGAHPLFRGYRYRVGEHFAAHRDDAFADDSRGERTLLSLLIYLNDVEEGGETRFPEIDLAVTPRAGRALWFQHALLHEGTLVRAGIKYALRTNIVYRA